jgi:hypothetical protein
LFAQQLERQDTIAKHDVVEVSATRARVTKVLLNGVVDRSRAFDERQGHRRSTPTGGFDARPCRSRAGLERVMGIEPTLVAWEATVLPLNYTRASG